MRTVAIGTAIIGVPVAVGAAAALAEVLRAVAAGVIEEIERIAVVIGRVRRDLIAEEDSLMSAAVVEHRQKGFGLLPVRMGSACHSHYSIASY